MATVAENMRWLVPGDPRLTAEVENVMTAPRTYRVVQMDNGHLECRDCGTGTTWCEHVQSFVMDGQDAKLIWDETQDGTVSLEGVRIMVPVVPTLSQWATLRFGDEHFGNYKMNLLTDSGANVNNGQDPVVFLGFFSPGEGRAALRSMLFAWFEPMRATLGECKSTTHSFAAQMQWDADVTKAGAANDRRRLAQQWSVFTTGYCLQCVSVHAAVSGDDLIPDGGGRSGWRR